MDTVANYPHLKIHVHRYLLSTEDSGDIELITTGDEQDVIDCRPDEFDLDDNDRPKTAVVLALEYLADIDCDQPSGTGGWHPHAWYSTGPQISNHYTGEEIEISAHPYGFSDDEQRQIYNRMR